MMVIKNKMNIQLFLERKSTRALRQVLLDDYKEFLSENQIELFKKCLKSKCEDCCNCYSHQKNKIK